MTTTINEAGPVAGGMMRFGIPTYRLPRDVVNAEIERITNLGVTIELSCKVEDIPATMETEGFDACFVAIGAHLAKRVDIPAPDAIGFGERPSCCITPIAKVSAFSSASRECDAVTSVREAKIKALEPVTSPNNSPIRNEVPPL